MSLALSGCVNYSPDDEQYFIARKNFHYQSDLVNEYRLYSYIDKPFYGDCEDFAFTLQHQMGGDVWYVLLNYTLPHAVLVKDSIVYDMNRKYLKSLYPGKFITILKVASAY